MRLFGVLIVMVVVGICLPTRAQSPAELSVKYGPPAEAYEIRPHVLMTVKYSQDNQVSEYVIEARHNSGHANSGESLMSEKLVNELIDELAPSSQRGNHQRSITFTSGCNELSVATYERIEIRTVATCPSPGGNRIASIVIGWVGRRPKSVSP